MTEQIIILDFGSQCTQVIARRVRECNVYSVILRYDTSAAELAKLEERVTIIDRERVFPPPPAWRPYPWPMI